MSSESEDTKTLCGRCGQEIEEPSKILDHIVLVHHDQEAGWLLNNLNRLMQSFKICDKHKKFLD